MAGSGLVPAPAMEGKATGCHVLRMLSPLDTSILKEAQRPRQAKVNGNVTMVFPGTGRLASEAPNHSTQRRRSTALFGNLKEPPTNAGGEPQVGPQKGEPGPPDPRPAKLTILSPYNGTLTGKTFEGLMLEGARPELGFWTLPH